MVKLTQNVPKFATKFKNGIGSWNWSHFWVKLLTGYCRLMCFIFYDCSKGISFNQSDRLAFSLINEVASLKLELHNWPKNYQCYWHLTPWEVKMHVTTLDTGWGGTPLERIGKGRGQTSTSRTKPGVNVINLFTAVSYGIFVISLSVGPWQAFQAYSNVCG